MHNRNCRLQRNSQIAYFALCVHRSFNGFVPNDHSLEHLPWKFYPLQGDFFFPFPFTKVAKKQKNPECTKQIPLLKDCTSL